MPKLNSIATKPSFSVGFIGGGNMARSIIGGLATDTSIHMQVFDLSADTLNSLTRDFDITAATSNQQLVEQCDVVVLAVKPQVMQPVLSELDASQTQAVFLSIAAGLKIDSLAKWLDRDVAIIRAMPNTPALVQCGASGLYANKRVSVQQKEYANIIMQATGLALWVDSEDLLDSVTALSGSGPAYFFLVMEAMQAAAEKLGLNAEIAKQLTLQTALGAATLASQSDDSPATLRRQVTSPGGTTEQAINTLVDNQLIEIFGKAMQAAYDRARQLAIELDSHKT